MPSVRRASKRSSDYPLSKGPRAARAVVATAPISILNPIPRLPPPVRPSPQFFVWGSGSEGQMGLGRVPDKGLLVTKPTRHPWIEQKLSAGVFSNGPVHGLISIAAGAMHTLIIDEEGTVWSCGQNDDAALGRTGDESMFRPLTSLITEGFRAVHAAAGSNINAVISDRGEVRAWGSFRNSQGESSFQLNVSQQQFPFPILNLPGEEKTSSAAAGSNHLLFLTTSGTIYTWGIFEDGRLGRKALRRQTSIIPERVILGHRSRKAVLVGAGEATSFAVDDSGDVWAWGLNSRGQTGTGTPSYNEECVDQPKLVVGLCSDTLGNGDKVVQIVGGQFHTLFLTASGKLYACGACLDGQLGLPESHDALKQEPGSDKPDFVAEPQLVEFPSEKLADDNDGIVQISAAARYNMAITRSGVLFSWGFGSGVLGNGSDDEDTVVYTPQNITRREGSWSVKRVSCGAQHAIGLFQRIR